MTMWFPTLQFLLLGQYHDSKIKCPMYMNFKIYITGENQKNWFCLLIYRSKRKLLSPLLPEGERENFTPWTQEFLLETWLLSFYVFYLHFFIFHPLSLCALFEMFYFDLFPIHSFLFTVSNLLSFEFFILIMLFFIFHFQIPGKILNFVLFHWPQ